jgi:Right handed beta helix region
MNRGGNDVGGTRVLSYAKSRTLRNGIPRGAWAKVIGASLFLLATAFFVPFAAVGSAAGAAVGSVATDPGCAAAGTTGLTALIVATSHEQITGTIDATGCDIGVYVGPGVVGVHITEATISNANDHGIFVQDTSRAIIENDVVAQNGLAPHRCSSTVHPPCIQEDKAIELSGTSKVTVRDNVVVNNVVDGGIGVSDDGAIDPGAPAPGTLHVSSKNVIEGNTIANNAFGCGIVLAAYDSGAGVTGNVVRDNTVIGNPPGKGPFVGGIVVAADAPGTSVWDNLVAFNNIVDSVIPGIVVHSNTPGDQVWDTALIGNILTSNGFQSPPNDPTQPSGIEVVAEAHPGETNAPILTDTLVLDDSANQDSIGVWLCDSTDTKIIDLDGNAVTPVESC